jgi:hypothetical protein
MKPSIAPVIEPSNADIMPKEMPAYIRKLLSRDAYIVSELFNRSKQGALTRFLLQCYKGNVAACEETWWELRSDQQRDLLLCHSGSKGKFTSMFFMKIVEPEEKEPTWEDSTYSPTFSTMSCSYCDSSFSSSPASLIGSPVWDSTLGPLEELDLDTSFSQVADARHVDIDLEEDGIAGAKYVPPVLVEEERFEYTSKWFEEGMV